MASVAEFTARHACVGLDTSIFIYQYERVAEYLPATRVLFRRIVDGSPTAVTSVVTATELTVRPLREGRQDLVNRYTAILLRLPHLRLTEITLNVAQLAAQLRARYRLPTVDMLQVAGALTEGATGFVTNDRDFQRVTELEVLLLAETDEVRGRQ